MSNISSPQFELKISVLHKILLTVFFAVFISITANTFMAVKTESEVLRRGLITKGENLAQNIASSTKSAFLSLNWVFVEKMLQDSGHINGSEILFSKVVKPNGEVYLANNKKYYGSTIEQDLLVEKQTLIENFYFDQHDETGLLLVHPVLIGKERWYIITGLSLNPIKEASFVLVKRNILWGSLTILFAVIAAYFLARSISKPIVALASTTKKISDGDRTLRIDVKSKDEIGLLSHSFNKMIDSIDAAEGALISSNERFLTVLDSIDATIYVADMETREIIFMNRFMKESFGADLVGQKCYKAFRGLDAPCSHCTNSKLLDANGEPAGVVVWEDKNPLTQRWYMNHDRAIKWIDGRMVHLQVATDITNLKDMEEERKIVETELRQKHKMEAIGTLTGGIAHDFNNVLSILIGNAELALEDTPEDHPAHESLRGIMYASTRAKDLVSQLLSFSRKSEPGRVVLDLEPSVKETMRMLRATLPTSIDIEFVVKEKLHAIKADPTQVHQILLNLCTNSAHAMEKDGGKLQIILSNVQFDGKTAVAFDDLKPGKYVKLVVRDTGQGIHESIKERVFDPYFTTKKIGDGSGMGLSVVHGIVKNHHGGIVLESVSGKGTEVTVFFPAAIEQRIDSQDAESQKSIPTGTEKILIVDDEESILITMEKMLQRQGYDVTACLSPLEALELVRKDPYYFDMLMSDMTMPEITGDKLIKEVHQLCPDMPIVICTGYSEKMNAQEAKMIGASAYLEKPIRRDVLGVSIRKVLDAASPTIN